MHPERYTEGMALTQHETHETHEEQVERTVSSPEAVTEYLNGYVRPYRTWYERTAKMLPTDVPPQSPCTRTWLNAKRPGLRRASFDHEEV